MGVLLLADSTKLNAAVDTDAALLGLGYFTGLRYAAIIAAGSFFSWFVCIPIVYYLAPEHIMQINGHAVPLAEAPIRKGILRLCSPYWYRYACYGRYHRIAQICLKW